MDAKKEIAVLNATLNLMKNKTSEADIKISLKELGLNDKESALIIQKAKNQLKKPEPEKLILPKAISKGKSQEPLKSVSIKPESAKENPSKGVDEIKKAMDELKNEKIDSMPEIKNELEQKEINTKTEKPEIVIEKKSEVSEEKPKPNKMEQGLSFLKGAITKNISPKKEPTKEPNYIPELKKGGKAKVKEIIKESPLEKIKEKKEINSMMGLKEPENKEKNEIEFTSSLDNLQKKIEMPDFNEEKKEVNKTEKIKNEKKNFDAPIIVSPELTMLIIPNKEYSRGLSILIRRTSNQHNKIVYVTLNEIYSSLILHIKKLGANPKKFFFVDAVTMTASREITKHDNCIFVSSPNSLVELSLAITRALNSEKPDAMIFDSISTLLIYEKEVTVTKFIHSLIGKIKAAGVSTYFTALEGDSQTESVKDLTMFMDNVNTLTEFELGELGFSKSTPGLISQSYQKIEQKASPSGLQSAIESFQAPIKRQLAQEPDKNKLVVQEMGYLKDKLKDIKNDRKIQESLNEIKGKIGKTQDISNLEKQLNYVSEKINSLEEQPVNNVLLNQISKLEEKISSLEEKLSEKMKKTQDDSERQSLKEKIEMLEKKQELASMIDDFYKVDSSKVDPKYVLSGKLEKKMDTKKKVLDKAFKKGVISKDLYVSGKKRINGEVKRLKYSAEIASLEKKLDALSEAYEEGLISKESYVKGKARIETRLKK